MSSRVVDLERMISLWAWHIFKITKDKSTRNLKFEDLTFDINWKKMHFRSETPEYTEKKLKDSSQKNLIFKALYENRTSVSQDHHFATDRSTTCKCVTAVTEGFTRGTSLSLQLGLPNEVLMATASYGREITVETTEENETEQTVSWAVDTCIRVQPNHRSIVRLEVSEQQFTASFHVITRISGGPVVAVYTRKDNEFIETIEGKITEIVRTQVPDLDSVTIAADGKSVNWRVRGTCEFVYGVEQHVVVEEEELTDPPATGTVNGESSRGGRNGEGISVGSEG
ncbi:Lin-24 like family member [Elysia marginata]|uniref:Lin-24 like family member n=1 Tax=Elysia marginata TaxID=1093978 RepID=A0AAV4GG50_9GAST|nr:Lin-24 like family member [Elysia marginata]